MTPEQRERARLARRARWERMSEEQREQQREKQRARVARSKRERPEVWEARDKKRAAERMARYRTDPQYHAEVNAYQKELMRKRATEGKA